MGMGRGKLAIAAAAIALTGGAAFAATGSSDEEALAPARPAADQAIEKKVKLVEIIPGKGSGQLKKRVLRFLDRKDIKPLYDRVEKDSHNFGRVFVHFRHK